MKNDQQARQPSRSLQTPWWQQLMMLKCGDLLTKIGPTSKSILRYAGAPRSPVGMSSTWTMTTMPVTACKLRWSSNKQYRV